MTNTNLELTKTVLDIEISDTKLTHYFDITEYN